MYRIAYQVEPYYNDEGERMEIDIVTSYNPVKSLDKCIKDRNEFYWDGIIIDSETLEEIIIEDDILEELAFDELENDIDIDECVNDYTHDLFRNDFDDDSYDDED